MISNEEICDWSEILATSAKSEGRERSETLATPAKSKEQQWCYLAVKKESVLLRGIISKHHGDFYCLNCRHSFATATKLESRTKV